MTDPIAHARRRTLLTWLVAGPSLCALAFWAIAPVERASLPALDLDTADARPQNSLRIRPLGLAGFDAPVWQEPKTERATTLATAQQTPTVRFPDLELIAIVHEGDAYRAAIYLPAIDELVIAGAGESIGGDLALTVSGVTADAVTIAHAGNTRRIELKKPEIVTLGASG